MSARSGNGRYLVQLATALLVAAIVVAGASVTGVAATAVTVYEPDTLHSNGAELRWTRFDTASGTFDRYEVHRSATANFTPSASTLLVSIQDIAVTSYRDTTAAAGGSFSYRVVAAGATSNERRVTLPSAGEARKVLQPGPAAGKATFIFGAFNSGRHNDGAQNVMTVGTHEYCCVYDADERWRGLIEFDLGDIPSTASVSSAKLELYASGAHPAITAHRVTASWQEGNGTGGATGTGATWEERVGGTPWASRGGDYASTPVASATASAAGWDSYTITGLVQDWVRGTHPNLGMLLIHSQEGTSQTTSYFNYTSDDETTNPERRPKLTIAYSDGSRALAPVVDVTAPTAGETVRGSSVTLAAAASDDRRVEKVEFLVDGSVVGSDSSAPFSVSWNSASVANGTRRITARATDDAGNATTSAAVEVTVANSALPTATVTSPSASYTGMVKADGAEAYWRLGEASGTTAADASGKGRTATYSGSYLLGQTGLITGDANKAVKLQNATTDGGASSSNVSGLLGATLTAEAWVDYAALPTNGQYNHLLARDWTGSSGWTLGVERSSTGVQRAKWAIKQAGTEHAATATVTPGKLHLAGSYDGKAAVLYVNGARAASVSVTGATLNNTAAVDVGRTLATDVTVDEVALYNAALPAGQLSAHNDAGRGTTPSVSGTVTLAADASDDGTVERVEFLVDGLKVGEDTTAPYRATWNTLDAALPFYDGAHTITVRARDNHGQEKESAAQPVTVANAAGTRYRAGLTSTPLPQAVLYEPGAATQAKHGVDVTVTNTSGSAWGAGEFVLRPRWIPPDAATSPTDGADVALDALAAGASATKTVFVEAPPLPQGVEQAQYTLRIDVVEKSTSTRFADKGNKPLEGSVTVRKPLKFALGLEGYQHYVGEDLGAGMQHLTNVASGNSLVRWTPFSAPGRGLATVLDLTYNALEEKSESPVGNNWSLSISSLTRFGNPLDVHPNKADDIAGRADRYIDFTDGDGTTHRFEGKQDSGGNVYWEEPPGVHLYLREFSATDASRKWALTRPDRVTFFYDREGFPTSVEDANGNRLAFTLEDTPPGEDPGGPKKRVTEVTDAAGLGASPAPNRKFRIDYWSKDEAKKAHVRGNVQRITDHSGSALDFDYYDDGNLLRITQRGGQNADGSPLADRTFVFTYTTSSGDGPAIAAAADRVRPEPKTSNQSTRLYSVRDPRGSETTFSYLGPGNGQDRWRLASRTDRKNARTTFGYDTATRVTTVTAPLARASRYAFDAEGKVTSITNPEGEESKVEWSSDRHVVRVIEPNGNYVRFDYNANGYLTDRWDQLGNHTKLDYQDLPVDGGDVLGRWRAGRAIGHLSQLVRRTEPRGMATPSPTDDFQWSFAYDAKGNLEKVTDPENAVTQYAYNSDGTVSTITDPRTNVTTVKSYDANGLPTEVLDAKNGSTAFAYSDDGLLLSVRDPGHAGFSGESREFRAHFDYDSFHRMGRQSAPKSTKLERGTVIWSGVTFDENDNVRFAHSPHYSGVTDGGGGARTETRYDLMDRPELVIEPDTSADTQGERYRTVYDDAGRATELTNPRGMQSGGTGNLGKTVVEYDKADRVRQRKRFAGADTLIEHFCYDRTGELVSQTAPKARLATVDCNSTTTPYTTRLSYDAAHQLIAQVDPEGNRTSWVYDANGNVEKTTDPNGNATVTDPDDGVVKREYDERDRLTKVIERLSPTRTATTLLDYDDAGNLEREISPRAWDASSDKQTFTDFVTTHTYDALNRRTKTQLPSKGTETKHYVHRSYDANGNVEWSSQPVTDATTAPESTRTKIDLFDTGWVYRITEPTRPNPIRFDYSAEGWQEMRAPERAGELVKDRQVFWRYWPDGQVKERTDPDGGVSTFEYNAVDRLVKALDGGGFDPVKEKAVEVGIDYDDLDRAKEVRQRKAGQSTRFSTYAYDLNSNLEQRVDNGTRDSSGTTTDAGRKHEFTYDTANRLDRHTDHGRNSASTAKTDDRQLDLDFDANGRERTRTMRKRDASDAFTVKKQETVYDYLENGLPKSIEARNGSGSVLETHSFGYLDGTVYVNGHRTSDVFRQVGPKTDAPCRSTACTRTFVYDARERLVEERREGGGGATRWTKYTLLPTGNVDLEQHSNGESVDYEYATGRLDRLTYSKSGFSPLVQRYHYDSAGNVDCVTTASGSQANCSPASGEPVSNLLIDYGHDGLDRLASYRSWLTNGQRDKETTYTYDALDRVVEEVEAHGSNRTTQFTHLGVTQEVAEERHLASGTLKRTKAYAYDTAGHRVTMTDEPVGKTARDYTYVEDLQSSVSLLLDDSGQAKAQYGYTAYGDADQDLSRETDPSATDPNAQTPGDDPLNPFRYSGKRVDAGTGKASESTQPFRDSGRVLDMGARRFGPDTRQFLQQDGYEDAVGDLGLSLDPLTQNRYALAGGNPVSFVEVDGHEPISSYRDRRAVNYIYSGKRRRGTSMPRYMTPDSHDRSTRPVYQQRVDRAHANAAARRAYRAEHRDLYGSKRSKQASYPTGDFQGRRSGKVRIGLFIADEETAFATARGKGDARGFNPRFSHLRTRATFTVDFSRDTVEVHVSPTCGDVLGNVGAHQNCGDAKDIESRGSFTDYDNEVDVDRDDDGGIHISYELSNSRVPGPSIDGDIHIRPTPDRGRGLPFTVTEEGDDYPSREAYYHDPTGRIQTIFQKPENHPIELAPGP